MINIRLDPSREKQLHEIAARLGQDPVDLARRIIEVHLDNTSCPADREEDWAEASVALTKEIMPADSWG